MDRIQELKTRREEILAEMRSLRGIRRGHVNEQYLEVSHKGRRDPVRRGPYYVLTRSEKGKTVSRRLTSSEQVAQAEEGTAQYRRFHALCREFAQVTEDLAELQSTGASESPEKKRRRSPSSKAAK